jgi:hypothetical protein
MMKRKGLKYVGHEVDSITTDRRTDLLYKNRQFFLREMAETPVENRPTMNRRTRRELARWERKEKGAL